MGKMATLRKAKRRNEDQVTAADVLGVEIGPCKPLTGSNVFILGNTGAGKSTFLQWILGCEFEYVQDKRGRTKLKEVDTSTLDERFRIGHNRASCTSEIAVLEDLNLGDGKFSSFVDAPGFFNTEGQKRDFENYLKLRHALDTSDEARLIF